MHSVSKLYKQRLVLKLEVNSIQIINKIENLSSAHWIMIEVALKRCRHCEELSLQKRINRRCNLKNFKTIAIMSRFQSFLKRWNALISFYNSDFLSENHMWFLIEVQDAKQLYDAISSMMKRQIDFELVKSKKSVANRSNLRIWESQCQSDMKFELQKLQSLLIIWSHLRSISWFSIEYSAIECQNLFVLISIILNSMYICWLLKTAIWFFFSMIFNNVCRQRLSVFLLRRTTMLIRFERIFCRRREMIEDVLNFFNNFISWSNDFLRKLIMIHLLRFLKRSRNTQLTMLFFFFASDSSIDRKSSM